MNTASSLTRREFVLSAGAVAAFGLPAGEIGKPLLRIGAMTDNHLHAKRPATHRRTKACFDLFRRMNADIVVDTGDIADLSHVTELEFFRACFDEAFAGTDCVPFFCIANHDYNYVPNTPKNDPKNIENAWRALKMDGPNPTAVVKGYQFVNVFQNEPRPGAFDEAVARAVAANTDNRPVFVVNHVPPMLTTTGTVHWSSQHIRDVLDKYPQVVALTGHIHTSIASMGNIWQGGFTAVNLGAHAEYSNRIDGEAVILDVFADRIDVRRYEAVSGREIGADDRWSIPLPLDPAHGPYRTAVRAKASSVPTLPAEATARFEQSPDGVAGRLVFTSAEPLGKAESYRIAFESQQADGGWRRLTTLNWSVPQVMDPPATLTCSVVPALLDGGRPHRAVITPVNCFDVMGPSRTFAFDVPANPMTALSDDQLRICRGQRSYKTDGKDAFDLPKDGWVKKEWGLLVFTLPKAFAAAIHGKKTVNLVIDVASEQPGNPNTFSIGKFPADGGEVQLSLGGRIYTLPGTESVHRYAWTLSQGKDPDPGDEYFLVIREGDPSRYRINGVRCFVR